MYTEIPVVYREHRMAIRLSKKLRQRGLRSHYRLLRDCTYRVWVEGRHDVKRLLANYSNGRDERGEDVRLNAAHRIIGPMLETCCEHHTCHVNGLLYCEDAEECLAWFALPNPMIQGKPPGELLPCIRLYLGVLDEQV